MADVTGFREPNEIHPSAKSVAKCVHRSGSLHRMYEYYHAECQNMHMNRNSVVLDDGSEPPIPS
jgi:hypothetical protein